MAIRQTNDADLTLKEFVKTWNRNDDAFIENADGTAKINVTSMSAMKFVMMLQSLFADKYIFEVTSGFEILAIPKEKRGNIANQDPAIEPGSAYEPEYDEPFDTPYESKKQTKIDLKSLAERLDNDFSTIELYEDKIEISSERKETLKALAKIADKIDENLTIELYPKKLIIK